MSGIDGQNLADSLVLDAFYSSLSNHQRSSLCNPRPSNDFYKIELDFDNEEKLLFSWILKNQRYHLKFVDKDETFTNSASSSSDIPDIVFSIQKKTDIKFNPDNLKATVAFHGTNLGNLYSILNYGLNSHLNKRNLYGAGIYVASDLSTALSFATPSFGRKIKSKISMGATYKVVLQCSVVLHEDVIQNREQKERSFSFDEKVPAVKINFPI
ncbi:Protein mono-ADP-ribosyltransferase parp16 [Lobulomyces angularis]|nr:Protein mono-ADP-ribosyltransferase parp16 [Lobulomyces angularis]